MPTSRNRSYSFDSDTPTRRCTQCQTWLPETTDYFAYNSNRNLYNSWCKPCVAAHRRNVTTTRVSVTTLDRSFGVEIEFHGNASRVERELINRGLTVWNRGYTHSVSHTAWKIVPDGSVSNGAELVSPILSGEAGFAALKLACDALVAAGATVDRQTGLHVHHDIHNLTCSAFGRLVTNWANTQSATDNLVAQSRRTNMYCAGFASGEVQRIVSSLGTSNRTVQRRTQAFRGITRYRALNVQSYPKYGTVEIRQHQGTTDYAKISAWVRFGQAMITAAVEGTTIRTSDTTELLATLPLSDDVRNFLADRVTKLATARRSGMDDLVDALR